MGACEFSSKPVVEVLSRVVLESGEVAVVVMVLLISRMNTGEGRIGQEVRRNLYCTVFRAKNYRKRMCETIWVCADHIISNKHTESKARATIEVSRALTTSTVLTVYGSPRRLRRGYLLYGRPVVSKKPGNRLFRLVILIAP